MYKCGINDISTTIFKERYALHESETFEEACRRLAAAAASVESPAKIKEWTDKFYEELVNCRFVPGGRIWYGAGRPKATLLNCFALGTEAMDSREGWGSLVSHSICIGGQGGGLGVSYSGIRPRGAAIRGTGGRSTGSVSLMHIVNAAATVIEGGGGRRSAHVAVLSLQHPDLEEFVSAKLDHNTLNMMNISVAFDTMSPESFLKLVEEDAELELVWKNEIVKKAKARVIWDKILSGFLKNGEPGIINLHYANTMSNIAYHAPLVSPNPCGEIMLPNNGVCDLGHLVLPNFFKRKELDLSMLDKSIRRAVRFLDNILDVTQYPTQAIAEEARSTRRIGLGFTGLHDLMLLHGLRYGSDESLEFTDKLCKFIKNKSYETSTYIAAEKGSFPKFDAEKFLAGNFTRTIKKSLRDKIREHGIRNCALNTVAPTGTVSLLVGGCSNGCEPVFGPAYKTKRWRKVSEFATEHEVIEETVFHPLFNKAMLEQQDVAYFESVAHIPMEAHFRVQHTIQKHIDQSISKTILLPAITDSVKEEFQQCFKRYFPELKGITVYVQGSRPNEPVVPLGLDEAKELWRSTEQTVVEGRSLESCKDGKCDL